VTSKPDFKVMVLLLVFMQLTRDLFAIAKFLFSLGMRNVLVQCHSSATHLFDFFDPFRLLPKSRLNPSSVSIYNFSKVHVSACARHVIGAARLWLVFLITVQGSRLASRLGTRPWN